MTPTNVAYLDLDGPYKAEPNWKGKDLKFTGITKEDLQVIWDNRHKPPFKIWQLLDKRHDQERIEVTLGDLERKYGGEFRKTTK
jgi:hypothetical protein